MGINEPIKLIKNYFLVELTASDYHGEPLAASASFNPMQRPPGYVMARSAPSKLRMFELFLDSLYSYMKLL